MAANVAFQRALAFALEWEGGASNDPDDDGGLTVSGVTQATYERWRLRQGLAPRPVTRLDVEEREQIYFEEYWQRAGCYRFAFALSLALFDAAVNLGPDRAIHLLQATVGSKPDGLLGPRTITAVLTLGENRAAYHMTTARIGYYVARRFAKPTNAKFLGGWLNRCRALLAEIEPR